MHALRKFYSLDLLHLPYLGCLYHTEEDTVNLYFGH